MHPNKPMLAKIHNNLTSLKQHPLLGWSKTISWNRKTLGRKAIQRNTHWSWNLICIIWGNKILIYNTIWIVQVMETYYFLNNKLNHLTVVLYD